MRLAILAGGRGSRLDLAGSGPPKALAPIGGAPILWHLLRYYGHYGITGSAIALGHKGGEIRAWFEARARRWEPLGEGVARATLAFEGCPGGALAVDLVETGAETGSGGRIRRLGPHMGNGPFMLTWCDGLSSVDLGALAAFHAAHGRLATVTAVHPPSRYGHMTLQGDRVTRFEEKPEDRSAWINGAFFVLEPGALETVVDDATMWERAPMERLAAAGELMAYRHEGFWQCMDSRIQNLYLEELWARGEAPWKVWS